MTRHFIALLVLVYCASAMAADVKLALYSPSRAEQQLVARLDSSFSFTQRLDIARAFQKDYPVDAGVQIRASDLLAIDDPAQVRSYYAERAQANPKSELDLYMAGRYAENLADKQSVVAKILDLNQDSYWGAVLQSTAYPVDEDKDFAKAEAALLRAIQRDNSLPHAPSLLGEMWARTGKRAQAEQLFVEMSKQQPGNFDVVQRRLMLYPGEFKTHLSILDGFLEDAPHVAVAWDLRARVCRELGDWDSYLASMRKAVSLQPDAVNHYNLACGFSLTGQADSAYAHLFEAAERGLNDAEQYTEDEDLIPVREDKRWPELLAAVETSHAAQMRDYAAQAQRALPAQEKQKVAESRTDLPAPDFTLEQLGGGTVKLADLRGKVVVLDFWATWCGPCKMTMPQLDKFYQESREKGIEVYGINVWERSGTAGVAGFIEKSGYKFPILFGPNELAEAYGVRGIPTMFVIDKVGKIAHRHVGYNPQIMQILQTQTDELLK
ncbi:MAG: redoxin domain-containing protein [bacterium]|nr:redoxin domain-containing protein [bacterium]